LEQARELMLYRRVSIKTSDDVLVANGNLQQYRIPSNLLESSNIACLFAMNLFAIILALF